jgi:O-antigen/teichoic acid export membrane protein
MKEVEDFWHDYLTVLIGNIGVALFSIITFTMVIKLLSPEQFGMFNLFMSVAQIGLLFGSNWTVSAMIRFGKEEAITDGTIRKTFWARMLIFGMALPIFLIIFYIFRHRISSYIGFSSFDSFLVPFYFIALSISSLLLYPYQAMGRMKIFSLAPVVERMVYGILLLFLIANIFSRNVSNVALVLILASFFSSILLLLLLKREWIFPVETSKAMIKKIFNFSWPALPGGVAGYVVSWIDIIVIKIYLNTAVVGLYSVAYSIYNYLIAVPLVGVNLISLVLTAFLVKKREGLIMVYVKRFIPQAIFLWSLFVSIIMILSGPVFEVWVGPQYRPAVPPFILLAIGLVFRGIACAYTPIYTAYIMPKRYHLTGIFIALLNLVGDLIFIPRYGMVGAAIATTSAFFISSMFLLLMANHKLKIVHISPLLYSIPAVLCGFISLLINNFLNRLMLFILVFFITAIIARKSRLFEKKDVMMLEPVKMPSGLKKVIAKFICAFAFE